MTVDLLKSLSQSLQSEFDLSANKVRSGLKRGGLSRKDGYSLDKYISYKDAAGHNLAIAVRRRAKTDPIHYFVNKRAVAVNPTQVLFACEYSADQHVAAFNRFREELVRMLS